MAHKIRQNDQVNNAAFVTPVRKTQAKHGPTLGPAQSTLLHMYRKGLINDHVAPHVVQYLSARGDVKQRNTAKPPVKQVRAFIASMGEARARTLIANTDPRVARIMAIQILLSKPQHFVDGLPVKYVAPNTKLALYQAMRAEDPTAALEEVLSHPAHINVVGLPFALAEFILKEQEETFELIEENWNKSMALNAKLSQQQAEQNQIEDEQREQQEQADAALRQQSARSALNRLTQALAAVRAQVKAQLRHHWSTQVPRTTAVSNAPSGTEAVSSMDATQEVAVVQDGIKTVMHVRAAPSAAAIAVLAALRPPSSSVGPRTGVRANRQGFGAIEA